MFPPSPADDAVTTTKFLIIAMVAGALAGCGARQAAPPTPVDTTLSESPKPQISAAAPGVQGAPTTAAAIGQSRPSLSRAVDGSVRRLDGSGENNGVAGFEPLQIVTAETTSDGRIRAAINGVPVSGYAAVSPMHNMIAMRKKAMEEALRQRQTLSSGAPSFQGGDRAPATWKPMPEADSPETALPAPAAPAAAPAAVAG
jgi:hypothetical protein